MDGIIIGILAVGMTLLLYGSFFINESKKNRIEEKDRLLWRIISSRNDKVSIRDFQDYLSNVLKKNTLTIIPPSKKWKTNYDILFNEIFMSICDHIAEHFRMDSEFFYIDPRKLDEIMSDKIDYYFKIIGDMGDTYFDLKRVR